MRVLVTGGCGFIGSNVVDAYIEKGYDVAIIDNLSTGKQENKNEKARLYVEDICKDGIEEVFKKERPDIVNHHAAQISVPLSVQDPLFDAEVNIKGIIRLLLLCNKYNVKKFIFSSTGGAIYGDADVVPTGEDYVPEPASPYAIAKLSSEKYIRFFYGQYGLRYTILRYSNVYGPRQIPHGEAGVVAIFTEKLLDGVLPTLNHFPGEPQGMIRDYCYVKDIAMANLLATEKDTVGIFNIGTGKGTTTLELYRLVLKTLRSKGVDIPQAFDEPKRDMARPGDIKVSTLNPGKAKIELGWEAGYTVEMGLSETVDWYLNKR
ncbi:MAG TPA: NAD-dependent epimerase/dehydratase family protein [Syntrophorhabdaceae bacterium]|nr:NAD-dependent epimerase/dehydratase family protein [Syntrophorhabdaceae bacterium]HQE81033.1 NAD-dependent epimerase/dehydratase family protein [Syntrophorhabdaceae bacterium]HQH43660.1 NAD-dependent epimerase/dehydratase family protein [Syntrophorhabdaceae bacterium]HQK46623.1 NAD-dependent epimerase/dehydratase family protein [Syntrophorhabdaceae bacterium]HRR71907.1 NAD-dependent epimerase/dehydratase family protein [Syntrophorhabdaceae bacterium]